MDVYINFDEGFAVFDSVYADAFCGGSVLTVKIWTPINGPR